MKTFMDSIVDMDSPFSFCGGGGLADEELIGSTYFQEGTGTEEVLMVRVNHPLTARPPHWLTVVLFLLKNVHQQPSPSTP